MGDLHTNHEGAPNEAIARASSERSTLLEYEGHQETLGQVLPRIYSLGFLAKRVTDRQRKSRTSTIPPRVPVLILLFWHTLYDPFLWNEKKRRHPRRYKGFWYS